MTDEPDIRDLAKFRSAKAAANRKSSVVTVSESAALLEVMIRGGATPWMLSIYQECRKRESTGWRGWVRLENIILGEGDPFVDDPSFA